LDRFVQAQTSAFETALGELRAGCKRTHWMWFIFPQMRGLGRSPTAEFYGIQSLQEARAFLAHPLLGPRLACATQAVLALDGRSLAEIFGNPDDLKFRSSMTLFSEAAGGADNIYRQALARYCDGSGDAETLSLLVFRC
ncbi:MAG TPA: DUF1810 domain-containing protein, partial [Methylocella sp.]|nr:DUF1810 domain-containing protein [Methylocella sp.]